MKIYNFAMEVYDSRGSGIGCWRSCGQQEWELISHEVILQLLFSPLIHLTLVTQPFSCLFVFALLFLGRLLLFLVRNFVRWSSLPALPPLSLSVRHVNVAEMAQCA